MALVLLSAMAEEVQHYLDTCSVDQQTTAAGLTVHRAAHAGHALRIVQSGVGKVNAALATQLLIDRFDVDAVLCTGTAGALADDLAIGDLVVATDCVQHDLQVDFLGLPRGQVPFTDHRFFATDPTLREHATQVAVGDRTVRTGRVLTGDRFVEDAADREALRADLGGDCVEMEGAAVGQVCAVNDVPYLVVRAISDRADASSGADFQAVLEDAAEASARLVLTLLETLPPDALSRS